MHRYDLTLFHEQAFFSTFLIGPQIFHTHCFHTQSYFHQSFNSTKTGIFIHFIPCCIPRAQGSLAHRWYSKNTLCERTKQVSLGLNVIIFPQPNLQIHSQLHPILFSLEALALLLSKGKLPLGFWVPFPSWASQGLYSFPSSSLLALVSSNLKKNPLITTYFSLLLTSYFLALPFTTKLKIFIGTHCLQFLSHSLKRCIFSKLVTPRLPKITNDEYIA